MNASAGRILIIPKGNYNSSVTYEMLDLVYHNGTSWLAKKTVIGIEPSEANGEYWHKVVDNSQDYIVEQGTSNGWTYRKWNSGVAECWYEGYVNFTSNDMATTSISGLNILRVYLDFPFTFKTPPKAFANIQWRYVEWVQAGTTESNCEIRKFCNSESAVLEYDMINIYTVGNWK